MRFNFRAWFFIFILSIGWIFAFYSLLGRWGIGLSFALLLLLHFFFGFIIVNRIKNLWKSTPVPGNYRWEIEQIAIETCTQQKAKKPFVWNSNDTEYNVLSMEYAGSLHIFLSLKFMQQTSYPEKTALLSRLILEHKNGVTLTKTILAAWLFFWQTKRFNLVPLPLVELVTKFLFPHKNQIALDKLTKDVLGHGEDLAKVIEKIDHWNEIGNKPFAAYTLPLWFVTPTQPSKQKNHFAVSKITRTRISSLMGRYPF